MAFNGITPDSAGYGTTNLYSQDPFAMAFNALQNAQQGHRTKQYRQDVQSANQVAAEQAGAQRQMDAFESIMSNAVTARDTPGFSTAAMAAMDQLSGSVGGRSFQPSDALMQLFSQRDQGLAQQPMAEAFQAQGAGAASYANAGQISSGFTPGEAPRSEVYAPLLSQAAGVGQGGGGGNNPLSSLEIVSGLNGAQEVTGSVTDIIAGIEQGLLTQLPNGAVVVNPEYQSRVSQPIPQPPEDEFPSELWSLLSPQEQEQYMRERGQ